MIESLRTDFEIPDSVSIVEGVNGLPKAVLTHCSGSRAEVYMHGAQVTSWTNPLGEEILFLSGQSQFAPGKPIRGGIPVIFPQFGGAGPLPQHGFARTSEWELARTEVLGDNVIAAEFRLSESTETLALWAHQFTLEIRILLDENALTVAMQSVNTGRRPFEFQAALHTYFRVADIRQAAIQELKGTTFVDALRDKAREVELRPAIQFAEETDRIYVSAPNTLRLEDKRSGRRIIIQKQNMPDAVVWNPWIEKARRMADFGDDEYEHMVCIETGTIASPPVLLPDETWSAQTTFSCA